jgi:D-alanyl-D-alanine-carboxypeptidase/D-alanyl-D-alanine-endopeptidase
MKMNRFQLKLAVCLLALVLPTTVLLAAEPAPGEGAAGEWLGALDVGSTKLRLALHVETKGDGSLGAVLDSIDQGAKIPVDVVVFERGTLRLTFKGIAASYQGALNADGSAVQGTWSQSGQELPLTFHRLEKAAR